MSISKYIKQQYNKHKKYVALGCPLFFALSMSAGIRGVYLKNHQQTPRIISRYENISYELNTKNDGDGRRYSLESITDSLLFKKRKLQSEKDSLENIPEFKGLKKQYDDEISERNFGMYAVATGGILSILFLGPFVEAIFAPFVEECVERQRKKEKNHKKTIG